jgi:hypothetical protein
MWVTSMAWGRVSPRGGMGVWTGVGVATNGERLPRMKNSSVGEMNTIAEYVADVVYPHAR